MIKPYSVLKNKLFWLAVSLLVFLFFPRPAKVAGKYVFKKVLPWMPLLANIISVIPIRKQLLTDPGKPGIK